MSSSEQRDVSSALMTAAEGSYSPTFDVLRGGQDPDLLRAMDQASRFENQNPIEPGESSAAAFHRTFEPAFADAQRAHTSLPLDPNAIEGQFPLQFLPPSRQPHYAQHYQSQRGSDDSSISQKGSSGPSFSPSSHVVTSGLPAPGSPFLQQQFSDPLVASVLPGGAPHQSHAGFVPQNAHLPGSPFLNIPPGMPPPGTFNMSAPFAGVHPMAMHGSPFNMPSFMGMLGPQQHATATGRTVYVGNLPAEASVDELLNLVKFGPIENVRLLPEKSCAFISFLDGSMAAAFHADASVKKLSLHNQELKIGWGKPSSCPTPILMAVQQHQATRNVYLGQLDEDTSEQALRDELSRFGPIDQVKIVRDKNIGFVHFLAIATAMKVVSQLPSEPAWSGRRVNYGKDRCAYVPKSQQQNQAHNSQAAAMGLAAAASLGYPTGMHAAFDSFGPGSIPRPPRLLGPQGINDASNMQSSLGAMFAPVPAAAVQQAGNRTVYLGNIHPETTTEEICNHVRGGILQTVRFISEKHVAFVTFIEASAALAFHHFANYTGIMIHQRRLKVGWGKHSGPLNPALAMAVQSGGSRNVYIGNIEDFNIHTVEKLRRDFGEYGETELVNTLKEKSCAFVNFCNIQNAIKAVEAMKKHPDYQKQRVGAGKDRCGNPPRVLANSLQSSGISRTDPILSGESRTKEGLSVGAAPVRFVDSDSSMPASVDLTSSGAPGLGAIIAHDEA